jgi:outer membrane protein assembly factor BamB
MKKTIKKRSTLPITVLLTLILIASAIIVNLPYAITQQPLRIDSYPFLGAIPNRVGVNQEVLLHLGSIYPTTWPQTGWTGITVSVTKPDGQTETLGPFKTDLTGGSGTIFVPTMVGTYSLQATFPEQVVEVNTPQIGPAGTILEAGTSEEVLLEVLADPVPIYPGFSPPNEFWTRPIDAQKREWASFAGNWLDPWPYLPWDPLMRVALYNDAPETGHILWTKPLIAMGGLAGGPAGDHSFECGDAYEGKWLPPVILGGILYYNQFEARGGSNVEQIVVAVNLRTGEELWKRSLLDSNGESDRLEFGQLFYWTAFNYHGVFGYLWTTTGRTWNAFDASTGRWVYSIENVPSGQRVRGPRGEIIVYSVDQNDQWMTKWNSTKVVNAQTAGSSADGSWRPHGNVFDAARGIEWNVSIPAGLPRGGGGGVRAVFLDDRILLSDDERWSQPPLDYVHLAAISTQPATAGNLIFNVTWAPPNAPSSSVVKVASAEDGVIIIGVKETRQIVGLSFQTGQQLWESESQHYLEIYSVTNDRRSVNHVADGVYYSGGISGIVSAYDISDGDLLWTYEAKDPNNEILWGNNWVIYGSFVSDGKLFVHSCEHSVIDPKPRGVPFMCIDAKTGDEVWTINLRGHHWGGYPIIGDSTIAIYNTYDQRIYSLAKGPSATTVSAPDNGVELGNSVMIRGTVMDISPGTESTETKLRFPNGVPAVADECMSDWMMYVYSQFNMPADVAGVTVKLEAVDPNGNYQNLGTTTTDMYGNFGFMFEPEVEGQYMILSSFDGSNSYYGSQASTYLAVGPTSEPSTPIEPEEPTEPEEPAAPLISTEIAIVIAVAIIAIIGVAAYWFLRRK